MQDNIYDKLERIEDKVDTLSPTDETKPRTLEEQIQQRDPELIEFIKSANRVFRYDGDKSDLKRENKKYKIKSIIGVIIVFLALSYLSSAIYLINNIAGIVSISLGMIFIIPYAIKAFKRPHEYIIPYKDVSTKFKVCDYDDNDIICNTKKVWYIKAITILSSIYLSLGAILAFVIYASIGFFYAMLGLFIIIMLSAYLADYYWGGNFGYNLIFENEKHTIPYSLIKEFMTENNLK